MSVELPFRRVAVLGTGLIGGSFGLAIRQHFQGVSVIGFDREEPLARAIARGAVQEFAANISDAVRDADLVYVALPIAATIDALPSIAANSRQDALVTDACSTKKVICTTASRHFQKGPRFLGGHPMAGKERCGIDQAFAEIFVGAPYVLIGSEKEAGRHPQVAKFIELLQAIGARSVWSDAETHDWAVSIVSHLPQLAAVALAGVVGDETDETGLPVSLAGKGLQDSLRLAASPYSLWRDILLTNRENIAHALDRLAQAVEHLRANLSSKLLEEEFQAANEVYDVLREQQQKPEN